MYHYRVSQSVSDVFLAGCQAVHFFLFLSCSHNTPTATMPRVPPPPPPSRGGVGPPARLLNAPPPPPRDGASSPGPVSRSAPPPPIPERSPRYADGESLSLSLTLSVCLPVCVLICFCLSVCLPACLPACLALCTHQYLYLSLRGLREQIPVQNAAAISRDVETWAQDIPQPEHAEQSC